MFLLFVLWLIDVIRSLVFKISSRSLVLGKDLLFWYSIGRWFFLWVIVVRLHNIFRVFIVFSVIGASFYSFCAFTLSESLCAVEDEDAVVEYILENSSQYEVVHRCYHDEKSGMGICTESLMRREQYHYPTTQEMATFPVKERYYHGVSAFSPLHASTFRSNEYVIKEYLSTYYDIPLKDQEVFYEQVKQFGMQYKFVPMSVIIDHVIDNFADVHVIDKKLAVINDQCKAIEQARFLASMGRRS